MTMSEAEIIRIEYEAIKKFCRGDKGLALKITSELGLKMRDYIDVRNPSAVTVEELCGVLETALTNWNRNEI